uniref:Uncharacterized protein n=1 Tax=Plectus sambesii TaxID=2011161 RepID=A0A914WMG7_9BILA
MLSLVNFFVIEQLIETMTKNSTRKYEDRSANAGEMKLQKVCEFIDYIRVAKLCGWEDYFLRQFEKQRSEETRNLKWRLFFESVGRVLFTVSPFMVSVSILVVGEMGLGDDAFVGRISYAPQRCWLENETIRNNILFGKSFEEHHYNQVINACGLTSDFLLLPDLTMVVQNGANLSGGQRQRVSLARAVYQDAPVIVLDDFLSAVDQNLCQTIISSLFSPGGLLANKSVLIASGSTKSLPRCTTCYWLEDYKLVKLDKQQFDIRQNAIESFSSASPTTIDSETPNTESSMKDTIARYPFQDENILHAIDLVVEEGQRCAVIGRTGSGKSSLTLALMNCLLPNSGTFNHQADFFEQMSFIPQECIQLTGSLRDTVDPYHRSDDESIIKALKLVKMWSHIRRLPNQFDCMLEENDSRISIGQRQLLAIARVLLENRKYLILDEATASVDDDTRDQIKELVDNHFANKTIIEVTHRIKDTLNADIVVLMESGKVVERGRPKVMLNDARTTYSSLWQKNFCHDSR